MILVSSCLAGFNCRYDGKNKSDPEIVKLVKEGKAIPVCPEQLGGLSTPRIPAEQQGERIITKDGKDVTSNYINGAKEAYNIFVSNSCSHAILKSKSPMCGKEYIYDGTFSGKLIQGSGIFAKLLLSENIKIETR